MFDNSKLEDYLERRNSKILGGYITEQLFIDTFVSGKMTCSDGWWIALARDKKKSNSVHYFVSKDELSDFDVMIMDILHNHNRKVHQIALSNNEIVVNDDGNQYSLTDFVAQNELIAKTHSVNTADDALKRRCIAYYTLINKLSGIARSIYIEDSLLNKYFYPTNIDLFIQDPNTKNPICVEIKFKDEFEKSGKLVFGEDRLQYETLFPEMRECGIDVYNCVLYNHIGKGENNEVTNIFNYIESSNRVRFWKKKKFTEGENHSTHSINKKNTQFWGEGGRSVYCIPLAEYTSVSDDFFSSEPDMGWKVCPICGGKMVIRKRKKDNHEFFGCINYMNHE